MNLIGPLFDEWYDRTLLRSNDPQRTYDTAFKLGAAVRSVTSTENEFIEAMEALAAFLLTDPTLPKLDTP